MDFDKQPNKKSTSLKLMLFLHHLKNICHYLIPNYLMSVIFCAFWKSPAFICKK